LTSCSSSSVAVTPVALVPLEDESRISLEELSQVAAALEIQALRDLAPVWGVSASVSAFARLDDVPPGYLLLAVVADELPARSEGFHFVMAGIPFAMVKREGEGAAGWSRPASHELLEMLCNPFTERTALAPIEMLAAAGQQGGAKPAPGGGPDLTGLVNYVVEVCDPCEDQSYSYYINGLPVSDFVTPHYFAVNDRPHGPYSFAGNVKRPFEVLDGGGISWRMQLPDTAMYQAHAQPSAAGGSQQPAANASTSAACSAQPIAANAGAATPALDLTITKLPSADPANASQSITIPATDAQAPSDPTDLSRLYKPVDGQKVRGDFEAFLNLLKTARSQPSLGDIINRLKQRPPDAHPALEYLQQQEKMSGVFGADFTGSGLALWECMHIS